MGNKPAREEPEQHTISYAQRLSATFKDFVGSGIEGSPTLDRNSFSKKLFNGRHQTFTDLLFNSATRKDGISSDSMNEHDFCAFGEQMLQMTANMEQLQWYFTLFSTDGKVSKQEMLTMLHTTCLVTYSCAGMDMSQIIGEDDPVLAAMVTGLFGPSKDYIEWSDFKNWSNISCIGLFLGCHKFTLNALFGRLPQKCEGATSCDSEAAFSIQSKSVFLSWTMLWAVCATLSQGYVYFPTTDASPDANPSSGPDLPDLPLEIVVNLGGWQQLYSSNKDGLSVTRFKTKVSDYKGPSVTLFAFQDTAYCLGLDEEWRESTEKLGGVHSSLVQILPQYKYMQGGAPLLYFNLTNRLSPQNLSIGKTPQTTFIKIDSDFAKANHYGIDSNLAAIEVWGCASKAVRNSQLAQQQWNEREVDKHKNRKLKIGVEEWKDSPDRQILEMGGVNTDHAER